MLRSHTGVSAVPSLIHSPPFGARSSARLERIPDKDEVGSSSLPGPTRPFPRASKDSADPLTPAGRRHADYRSDISGLERAERAAGVCHEPAGPGDASARWSTLTLPAPTTTRQRLGDP